MPGGMDHDVAITSSSIYPCKSIKQSKNLVDWRPAGVDICSQSDLSAEEQTNIREYWHKKWVLNVFQGKSQILLTMNRFLRSMHFA